MGASSSFLTAEDVPPPRGERRRLVIFDFDQTLATVGVNACSPQGVQALGGHERVRALDAMMSTEDVDLLMDEMKGDKAWNDNWPWAKTNKRKMEEVLGALTNENGDWWREAQQRRHLKRARSNPGEDET